MAGTAQVPQEGVFLISRGWLLAIDSSLQLGDFVVHSSAGFVKATGNGGSLERGGILEPGECTTNPQKPLNAGLRVLAFYSHL